MKLLRFGSSGKEKPGLIDKQGRIRDLSGTVADIAGDTLLPVNLAKLRTVDVEKLPLAPADSRIGPCVGSVGKFICIGLNFSDHAAESGQPIPTEPIVFAKWTS